MTFALQEFSIGSIFVRLYRGNTLYIYIYIYPLLYIYMYIYRVNIQGVDLD